MKKTVVAIAVGLLAGIAHAQTNVAINGQLDIGVLKETGSDTRMMRNHDNLLRFKGTEELGNGTQAVFTLESRWDSSDGVRCSGNNATDRLHGTPGVDWQGAANVGVQNREWGRVLLGRVSNVSGENYSKVDPFLFDGIALSVGNMTLLSSSQTPNSLRYDSPSWHGLRFNGSYSVGRESHKRNADENAIDYHAYGNDGFVLGAVYENDRFFLLADIERIQDSDNSWGWNVGTGYTINDLTLTLGYHTHKISHAVVNELLKDDNGMKQNSVTAAAKYQTGPHVFKFSYNWAQVDSDGAYNGHSNKYGFGYDYALSKRTTLYTIVAYIDNSNSKMGRLYNTNGTESDSMTGVNFGITHRF